MSKEKDNLIEKYPKYKMQIEASMSDKTLEKILVNIILGILYFYFIQANPMELSFLNKVKMFSDFFTIIELLLGLFLAFGYFVIIVTTNHLFKKYEKSYKSKWDY